eukprot:Pgem_evm1s12905
MPSTIQKLLVVGFTFFAGAVSNQNASSRLISCSQKDGVFRMEIEKGTLKVLETFKNFKQVSIFGAARQGKSTLMSMLADSRPGSFMTDPSETISHTMGSHMTNKLRDTASGNKIMFVDTEGQDFRDQKYDYKLLMPTIMMSNVLLLNFCFYNPAIVQEKLSSLAYQIKEHLLKPDETFGHLHLVFQQMDADSVIDRDVIKLPEFETWFKSITIWYLPNERERIEHKEVKIFELPEEFSQLYRDTIEKMRGVINSQIDNEKDSEFYRNETTFYTDGNDYLRILNPVVQGINEGKIDIKISDIRETVENEFFDSLMKKAIAKIKKLFKEASVSYQGDYPELKIKYTSNQPTKMKEDVNVILEHITNSVVPRLKVELIKIREQTLRNCLEYLEATPYIVKKEEKISKMNSEVDLEQSRCFENFNIRVEALTLLRNIFEKQEEAEQLNIDGKKYYNDNKANLEDMLKQMGSLMEHSRQRNDDFR